MVSQSGSARMVRWPNHVPGHVSGFCREIRGFLTRPWSIWPPEGSDSPGKALFGVQAAEPCLYPPLKRQIPARKRHFPIRPQERLAACRTSADVRLVLAHREEGVHGFPGPRTAIRPELESFVVGTFRREMTIGLPDWQREAPPGFEPGMADLQSAAFPLG